MKEVYVVIWRCEDVQEVQIIGAYNSFDKAYAAMIDNLHEQTEQCEQEDYIDSWLYEDSARLSTRYNEQYWDIQSSVIQ